METDNIKSHVYILTNRHRNVIYVGSTDDLRKRIYFHKKRLIPGFTKKYNVDQLVYYESYRSIEEAFAREKQIKGYKREKKNTLILETNPLWVDLFNDLPR
jgi:putative endonuclease